MAIDMECVGAVLEGRGLVARGARLSVEPLSGGVSADVVLVRQDGEPLVVLKRARRRLAVDADWQIDPARTANEARCLAYLASILPAGSVPAVRFLDENRRLLAMDVIPLDGPIWKRQLLAGVVEPETARRVGALLGRVHARSAADPATLAGFDHPDLLRDGRTDPFHRAAAAVNRDLARVIEREAERLEHARVALVLGDVSPKNVVVFADRVVFFDVEIAHWGDPAFDVAFCLTHLVLKALVLERHRDSLARSAMSLWESYRAGVPRWPDLERHVIAELGCLLLARVDGKSPVEYVEDDATKQGVRRLARTLLTVPGMAVGDVHGALLEAIGVREAA